MKQVCLVSMTNVYGRPTIYPENSAAKLFAHIAGTKTLTQALLNDIRALGFAIEIKQQVLEVA